MDRRWNINLQLEVSERDLDSAGLDDDAIQEELSHIAWQWVEGLEQACFPPVRGKAMRSEVAR